MSHTGSSIVMHGLKSGLNCCWHGVACDLEVFIIMVELTGEGRACIPVGLTKT